MLEEVQSKEARLKSDIENNRHYISHVEKQTNRVSNHVRKLAVDNVVNRESIHNINHNVEKLNRHLIYVMFLTGLFWFLLTALVICVII